jgi:hypothetical protein
MESTRWSAIPSSSLLAERGGGPHRRASSIARSFLWAEWEHRPGAPGEVPRGRRLLGGDLVLQSSEARAMGLSALRGTVLGGV